MNQILRHNNQIERLQSPSWLAQCNSIRDVLEELKCRDIWPAVETVSNRREDSSFYLGKIVFIDKDSFDLLCYSADGEWDDGVYKIEYGEVFRIEFNGKYCNHWNAFMRTKEDTPIVLKSFEAV